MIICASVANFSTLKHSTFDIFLVFHLFVYYLFISFYFKTFDLRHIFLVFFNTINVTKKYFNMILPTYTQIRPFITWYFIYIINYRHLNTNNVMKLYNLLNYKSSKGLFICFGLFVFFVKSNMTVRYLYQTISYEWKFS